MAEATFDRAAFEAQLATRRLGRELITRAAVSSTNDLAWEALAERPRDGLVVVADAQTLGRGRSGRAWHTAPGAGLALSVALFRGCGPEALPLLPLIAGLALAKGLERLGATPALKWPNDVLLGGRKVAGILCESRGIATAATERGVVVGAGVNVAQGAEDFPAELRASATSLALAGVSATREAVAAEFLNALEPRWDALQEGTHAPLLEAWRHRAVGWDRPVVVRAPDGERRGIARGLGDDGRLVLELEDGRRVAVLAGDVELESALPPGAR